MSLHRGDGWSVRLAQADDEPALRDLVRRIPPGAGVDVAQEREPDFFALPRLHGEPTTYVAEAGGRVVGCGTLVRRTGLVDGTPTPLGHVCDLRVEPTHRGARVLPALGRAGLEHARDEHGVELATTAVLDGNRRARGALERRGTARADQPPTRRLLSYAMADLPLAGPLPRPDRPVERVADADEVRRFWAEGQRRRLLGRPDAWPDWPGLGDRLAVRDRSGGLAACAVLWDAHAVKQQRVLRYGPRLAAFRALHDPLAALSGRRRLPAPGGHLRFAYLAAVEAEPALDGAERVAALGSLVDAARRRLAGGHHFLAIMEDSEAVRRALRRRPAVRLPVGLHAVCLPDSPWADADLAAEAAGRATDGGSGVAFEMALA